MSERRNVTRFCWAILLVLVLTLSGLSCNEPVASDSLQVLKPDSLERLKFDFNSNRNKVRLITILSPT